MPCNWLADLRDCINSLRETADLHKDECYQLLNVLSLSTDNEQQQLERTETDGLTFNYNGTGHSEEEDSSRIGDTHMNESSSEGGFSSFDGKGISHRNRVSNMPRRDRVNSPESRRAPHFASGQSRNRKLMTVLTDKNMRTSSADPPRTGLTSQRTPKSVSFN